MGVTRGPQFPGIQDGLVFCFDPKNKDCWDGGVGEGKCKNLKKINTYITGSPSGFDTDETYGALTTEGYFNYDGTDDTINFEDTIFPSGDNEWTYAGWAKWDVLENYAPIFAYGTNSTNQAFFLNIVSNKWKVDNWSNQLLSITTLSTGTWYNVCTTYDGDYRKIYVNGVLEATDSSTQTLNITLNGVAQIGAADICSGCPEVNGQIGPIIGYNRALTAVEVLTNYNRLKGRFGL